MNKSIRNKNILVIGGGTGMGRAIAVKLWEDGNQVAIAGRREEKLTEVAKISLHNIKINPVDVTDRDSVEIFFCGLTKILETWMY